MQSEKSYFDSTINKYICVSYEIDGYCDKMASCKYYHRNPENSDNVKTFLKNTLVVEKKPEIRKFNNFVSSYIDSCHNCKNKLHKDYLFCNSFCGHYFCCECVLNTDNCYECKVQFDVEASKEFFSTYCIGCRSRKPLNQKIIENLCNQCEKTHLQKRNEEALYHEKLTKMKDNPLGCILCTEGKKQFCVFPCAHMLYCGRCIEDIKNKGECYLCQESVESICKIFY